MKKKNIADFYADLGWHHLDTYNKKLNIFKSGRQNNIPIYSEEQAEYENLRDYGKLSTDLEPIVQFFIMLFLLYFNFKLIGIRPCVIISYGLMVALTMLLIDSTVMIFLNMMYRNNCKKSMEKTGKLPKNVLLKKWRVWENYCENLLILLISFMTIFGFGYEIWGKSIIPNNEMIFENAIYFVMALVGFWECFLQIMFI